MSPHAHGRSSLGRGRRHRRRRLARRGRGRHGGQGLRLAITRARKSRLPGAGEPRLLGARRGTGPSNRVDRAIIALAGARRSRRRRRRSTSSSAATTATSTCGTARRAAARLPDPDGRRTPTARRVDRSGHRDHVRRSPGASRGEKIMDSPGVGDIDDDGSLDIVVGTNEEYVRGEAGNIHISHLRRPLRAGAHQRPRLRDPSPRQPQPAVAGNRRTVLPGWPVKIGIFLDDLLPTVGHGVGSAGGARRPRRRRRRRNRRAGLQRPALRAARRRQLVLRASTGGKH